jgi:hypothetical protein
MAMRLLVLAALCSAIGVSCSFSQKVVPVNPELGKIEWLRDFDAAAKKAKTEKRPMLVLFQEVPG